MLHNVMAVEAELIYVSMYNVLTLLLNIKLCPSEANMYVIGIYYMVIFVVIINQVIYKVFYAKCI